MNNIAGQTGTQLQILYLEDQSHDADLVHSVLAQEGLECNITRVETRDDFESALNNNSFDLIFSDEMVPSFDYLSALTVAREKSPGVPFIFVSGTLGEEVAIEGLKNGATDYVLKQRLNRLVPVTRRALREAEERKERRRAEEALRASERRFRAMIENSGDAIALLRTDGGILYGSPSTARVLGYTAEELVGRNIFDLIHEDDRALVLSCLGETLQRPGTGVEGHARVRHKNGSWRWLEGVFTNLLAEPGVGAIVNNYRDITERKKADETLRASEAKYRALVEQAADAIVIFDSQLTFEDVNTAACEMLGYTREELVGYPVTKLVLQEELARRPIDWAALTSGQVIRNERLVVRRDGTSVPVETSTNMLADGRIQTIARDITQRKKTEEVIQRHTLTFETIQDAILFIDVQSRIFDCNPAAERVSGYSKAELLGQPIDFLQPPGESPFIKEQVHEDLERTGRWSGERVFVRKDGTEGVSETVIVLMRDEAGQPFAFLSSSHDITERKLAEEALRASEQKFRAIFEKTLDAIFIIDREGRFVEVNPAAARLTGHDEAELSQMSYHDFRGHGATTGLELLWQEFLLKRHGTGEIAFQNVDGEVKEVEYFGKADFTPGYHLAVVHDITERKRAEEERLAREAAEQANRAKSEFISRMSHELRTPLNAILGFSQLLQISELTPKQSQNVGYVMKAGEHLLALINEVLDIARIEAGHSAISLEPVEVREAIRECLELIEPMATQRDISLSRGNSLDCPWHVMADRQRLRQVLLNVMSNAVKYNRQGGTLALSCEEEGERLRIRVTDTGPGISRDKLVKLFTPFERLGVEGTGVEGTGLGLALSKHIVEAMGGTLSVESEVGSGSTFLVDLAIADSPVQQLEKLQTGPLAGVRQPNRERTILYVEDNLSNLKLIEGILDTLKGTRLLTAMQGTLAIEIARQQQPELILLDLHLPDMNGAEVLKRLQEDPRTSAIPVVVVSADVTRSQIERLREAGAREYLTKPLSIHKFLQILSEVFGEVA